MDFDFDFLCPHCNSVVHAMNDWIGREAKCKFCNRSFVITPPGNRAWPQGGAPAQPVGEPVQPLREPVQPVGAAPQTVGPAPPQPSQPYANQPYPNQPQPNQPAAMPAGASPAVAAASGGSMWPYVVIVMLLAVLGGGAAFHFSNREDSESSPSILDEEIATKRKVLESLKDEIEQEKDKLEGLEEKERRLLDDHEELERDQKKLHDQIDGLTVTLKTLKLMGRSHFIVSNGTSWAVGMRRGEDKRFFVVGKIEGGIVPLTWKMARRRGIRWSSRDFDMVCKVWDHYQPGEALDGVLARRMPRLWIDERIIPMTEENPPHFVAFRDFNSKRPRMGVYLRHDDDSLTFFGRKETTIRRTQIVEGSAKKGKGDDLCRLEEDTDFLDYALLNAVQSLGTGYVQLAISVDVDSDILSQSIKLELPIPLGREKPFEKGVTLKEVKRRIEDEAYGRLVELGVPVLEREHLETIEIERKRSSKKGFEQVVLGDLLRATHQLYIDVGSADTPGRCRLSVRLVDLDSGNALCAKTREHVLRKRAPADYFLLHSGKLAVLESKKKEGESRLVYQEPAIGNIPPRIRELFSAAPIEVVHGESVKVVDKPKDDVPMEELMRYVVWRIARKVMPPAGMVETVDGGDVRITLGKDSGIHADDPFHVIRATTLGPAVLPVELHAGKVDENSAVATVADTGIEVLWSGPVEIQPGDLVRPKAVLPPQLSIAKTEPHDPPRNLWGELRFDNPVRRAQIRRDTLDMANLLTRKLGDASVQLNIDVRNPTANGGESFYLRGGLHLGRNKKYYVRIELYSINERKPLDTMEFQIRRDELGKWEFS